MLRSARLLLLIALVATFAVAPASAQDTGCTDPDTGELVLSESKVWLEPAETKAGNLGALGVTGFPTWDDEAPTQSVTAGAGGGYLAAFPHAQTGANDEIAGLTVVGETTGCLDTLLVELYAFLPTNRTGISGSLSEAPLDALVALDVDGAQVAFPERVVMNTVANPGGNATYRLRFAWTNLHAVMEDTGVETGPDATHELRFTVNPQFVNTSNALFVYDTTEVPANLTFNGDPGDEYPTIRAY